MLQARMFSYPDVGRYRVGPDYRPWPCNRAKDVYSPYQRDGPMRPDDDYGANPDYVRSSFHEVSSGGPTDEWVGKVADYTSAVTDEDFEQTKELWRLFKE